MDEQVGRGFPGASDDEDIETEWSAGDREVWVGYANFTDPAPWQALRARRLPGAGRPSEEHRFGRARPG